MKIRPWKNELDINTGKKIEMIPNLWFLHGELMDKYNNDKADIIELTRDEESSVFKFHCFHSPTSCKDDATFLINNGFYDLGIGFSKIPAHQEETALWFIEGIYDVEIEGDSRPAVGFFWYVNNGTTKLFQRGLVVYEDDVEAYADANSRYQAKSMVL